MVCLLKPISFDRLMKYYDYETMADLVYKLTEPNSLHFLKEEFEELKDFYKRAQQIDAFVIIKVS